MIKLIIFDLDGVIIESKDTHFETLNKALEEIAPSFIISYTEHISTFDGLPTARKLEILSDRGLPTELHTSIKERKQFYTIEHFEKSVKSDEKLIELFSTLKADGYKIHVASNAVRYTIELILWKKGIMRWVDYIISNEDVVFGKPNPEMYLRCMIRAGVGPKETIIIEDSYVGRQGVHNSGAFLGPVNSPADVTLERIRSMITEIGNPSHPKC